MFGISSQAAKADVDLTDGIRALICERKAVSLFIDRGKLEKWENITLLFHVDFSHIRSILKFAGLKLSPML